MNLEQLIQAAGAMQQGNIPVIDALLKPRGKIAESPKNFQPGGRLQQLYDMNPHMRPGEFDPAGAKANSRRAFDTWQQDQMTRERGYGQLGAMLQGNDWTNKTKNGVPYDMLPTNVLPGLAGLVPQERDSSKTSQQNPQPTATQNQQQTQAPAKLDPNFVGPPSPRQIQNGQINTQTASTDGQLRINKLTGLPFGYRPGDDLGAFDKNVQAAGNASIQRTNQTTAQEIARRNSQSQAFNQQQQQVNPQYSMGPDGKMYPKAVPVQGADARITPDQFNAATQRNSYGNYNIPTDQAVGLQMEYMRQNGIGGVSPSLARDVNRPTEIGSAPRPMLETNQFLVQNPNSMPYDMREGIPQPANPLLVLLQDVLNQLNVQTAPTQPQVPSYPESMMPGNKYVGPPIPQNNQPQINPLSGLHNPITTAPPHSPIGRSFWSDMDRWLNGTR